MEKIVYKITNKINGKYYIGSTKNERKRQMCHYEVYKSATKQNNELHLDILKYGKENFEYEILYSSDDNVQISRIESKLIRENSKDENMYNITLGASGRRVFYKSDIEFIRKLYNEKKLYITEAYEKYFKGIVSFRAFKKVWHGDTFKDIMYEVYTEENKKWHFSKGQSRKGEINGNSSLKTEDIINIRRRKNNNECKEEVFEDYKNIIGKVGFSYIWNNKTWKHISI